MAHKIGSRFSKLKVIGPVFRGPGGKPSHVCLCDCGKYMVSSVQHLKDSHTKSCGCWRVQVGTQLGKANITHGETGSNLYTVWHNLHARCENPNDDSYQRYGARGIKVCKLWSRYEPFRDWANKAGYKKGLQIDRENNNGDYTPSNCRWVTCQQNNRNRSSNIELTYQGETKCLKAWYQDPRRTADITYPQMCKRVKEGWTPFAILTVTTTNKDRVNPERMKELSQLVA